LQTTLSNSYKQTFGQESAMYNSLSAKLNTIASNTHGLDPATLARLNSSTLARSAASENAAQAAVNAKGATTSATPGVENGVTAQTRGQVISNLETAKNTELGNTAIQDAELGVQERDKALGEEANLGSVYSASTGIAGEDAKAVGEQSAQANANEAQSSSWMGLVGGIADAAAGGLTKSLTSGMFPGSGSTSSGGGIAGAGSTGPALGEMQPSTYGGPSWDNEGN
jgi:hypothetical protein